MDGRASERWFWIAAVANFIAILCLFALIYASLIMLGLFTSPVSMAPFFLVPSTVLALSVSGLVLVRRRKISFTTSIAKLLHAVGLCVSFSLLGYLGLLASGIASGSETFLIPEGYEGDVYVVYSTGKKSASHESASYTIPVDGVLIAQHLEVKSWTGWIKTRYFYVSNGGNRHEITNHWDSTIPETPENLNNSRDLGIFFPRSGSFTDSAGCTVRFDQFYVGTKAFLLRKYKPLDLDAVLRQHHAGCETTQ